MVHQCAVKAEIFGYHYTSIEVSSTSVGERKSKLRFIFHQAIYLCRPLIFGEFNQGNLDQVYLNMAGDPVTENGFIACEIYHYLQGQGRYPARLFLPALR